MHIPALVAPSFKEDLISVAQLTRKGNKVVFTNKTCLLLDPSASLEQGTIIGERGSDNLYRLKGNITKPKSHQVWNAAIDLPKTESGEP